MKSGKFSLKWKDVLNAIVLTMLGQLLMTVSQAAEGTFPSLHDLKLSLIGSIKYAIIPYLLKNFFTDDVKQAQNTIQKAEDETIKVAAPNDKELNP